MNSLIDYIYYSKMKIIIGNLKQYMFSTVPGVEFIEYNTGEKTNMKKYANSSNNSKYKNGLPILVPSQYVDCFYISDYKGKKHFFRYQDQNS